MTTEELLVQACRVRADLDALSQSVESSGYRPEVKSSLARDIDESRLRIGAVIEACTPAVYAAV